jgi:arabinose-5-phosphate isomerase
MADQEATASENSAQLAARIIRDEASALLRLAETVDDQFEKAVEAIHKSGGRLIATGLGKSGLVARKIAATLTSTGTPTMFLHPVEGMHGDLGHITAQDTLLALSKSGKTEEVARLVSVFRQLGGRVIVMTENGAAPLSAVADIVLRLPEVPEACLLNLAPTSSTTMMMALGDGLAMALLERRGFKEDDFAQLHPDGTLGVGALLRARDLMRAGDELPVVPISAPFRELLETMSAKSLGMSCVVDRDGRLLGTITDGDLRRLIERTENPKKLDLQEAIRLSPRVVGESHRPITVSEETMAITCRSIMRERMITHLIVTDDKERPIGLVRMHDLLAAGLG